VALHNASVAEATVERPRRFGDLAGNQRRFVEREASSERHISLAATQVCPAAAYIHGNAYVGAQAGEPGDRSLSDLLGYPVAGGEADQDTLGPRGFDSLPAEGLHACLGLLGLRDGR
jgi:hypothetical protein